ncbi:hypothetical protein F5X71_21615 [Nocardia brasiliensis]|uniref:Uncharacterized protein n=1 Tax=Nocardia brasiliensis TaxID=37326 RepID=A0A6G9XUH8_NOCBR|nr:DUF6882 domain-containing protein [Nocardia brasiliensis]QIS04584.1 hypothetical protein F5X71_21615 [Nocardia brasiliensis]
MSEPVPLTRLLDDAGLLSLEHRLHVEEVLGTHRWQADMEAGRLEFIGAERTLVCTRFHLLGTADAESWLWAWANPWGFDKSLIAVARMVRAFGIRYSVAELCAAEMPVALGRARPEPHQIANLLADAAKVVSGHWSSYCGVTDGTCVAFLVEHPALQLPPPTAAGLARVLAHGVGALPLVDYRRAMQSYLSMRGMSTEFVEHQRLLEFSGFGITGTIEFDAAGQVVNLEVGVAIDRIELPRAPAPRSADIEMC